LLNFVENEFTVQLIDTHCHLYLADFTDDLDAVVQRAEAEGVSKMLLPAIDASEHEAMLRLEEKYPGKCLSMMGLHPCSVKADYEKELAIVQDYLEKRSFIAVGEIGLDFYWDKSFAAEQYAAFRRQIAWAQEADLPIVIHSRESIDACIAVVEEQQKQGSLRGVFHCFSGTAEQAARIADLGFYLGIGGVLTFKNAGLDQVIEQVDLAHIVLETDAPYLAPVPFRGKRNESSYLKYVLEKLSTIKQVPAADIAAITTHNAQNLFAC
jgi:TatD DNase family protein